MSDSIIEVNLIISGRVQMVGFRFFAYHTAGELNINGFVRNLPDRTVEITAQGNRENVNRFIARMRSGPSSARVNDVQVKRVHPISHHFHSFSIMH
jgi:acylphosphatase